jgi:hypothetical protein
LEVGKRELGLRGTTRRRGSRTRRGRRGRVRRRIGRFLLLLVRLGSGEYIPLRCGHHALRSWNIVHSKTIGGWEICGIGNVEVWQIVELVVEFLE